jgi:hypothetical protein
MVWELESQGPYCSTSRANDTPEVFHAEPRSATPEIDKNLATIRFLNRTQEAIKLLGVTLKDKRDHLMADH